jgi:hypothetical protein
MTGAQECHGGIFEMGSNCLLKEMEEVDEGRSHLVRQRVCRLNISLAHEVVAGD